MKNVCPRLCALLCAAILAGCGNDPVTRSFTERPPEHRGGPSIFAGRIIDNSARPLGGVIITARYGSRIINNPDSLPVWYQGITKSDGQFDIPRHNSRVLYLTFSKPGYVTHARWLYLLTGEETMPSVQIPITFVSGDVSVVNDTIIILYDESSLPPTK